VATYIPEILKVSGSLAEDIGISATDLDIRDLTSVSDSVMVEGGNTTDVKVTLDNEAVVLGSGTAYIGDVEIRSAVGISGEIAHNAVDSGAPVKIGAKAVAHGSSPSPVAAGDRTDLYANRQGIPFTIGGHPNVEIVTGKYTTAQSNTVLKAIGTDEKWVTTSIAVFCAGNNVVDCGVLIEYDDTADVRIAEHPGIVAGSGFTWGNGGGILAIGGDAQDLIFTSTPTVSGSIVVQVSGYVIES